MHSMHSWKNYIYQILEDINAWRKIFVIVVMKFKQGRNSGLQDFKRLQTASETSHQRLTISGPITDTDAEDYIYRFLVDRS